MNYTEIAPPRQLKNYVRYFWCLESDRISQVPVAIGPLADGCPGFIFQRKDKGVFRDMDGTLLPEFFLYGQTVSRTHLSFMGQFSCVGICFYPHALKSLFRFDAFELTDLCLNLNESSRELVDIGDKLAESVTVSDQINVLCKYLISKAEQKRQSPDHSIAHALTAIAQSRGNISLKELQIDLKISERSLERRFRQNIGISPKLFARIYQFQCALSQLRTNNYHKLSDIAFDNGYSDQSHFIRSFKEFAGFSPWQYQKQIIAIADNFPLLIK